MGGDLTEREKKAVDAASEIAKQLITLSTGVIAVSLTFCKDVFDGHGSRGLLVASWVLYLVAICFGVWTLMAIAGTLDPGSASLAAAAPEPDARRPFLGRNVRVPAALQVIGFVIATALSIGYGCAGTRAAPDASTQTQNPER